MRTSGVKPVEVRYVVTHVGGDGLRTLLDPAQGRYTFATEAEAKARTDALLANNDPEFLKGIFGDLSKIEVRPCECWPGHFDPIGVYFD